MQQPQPEKEKHSYANTAHIRTTNVSLHVDLDFTRKALHGFVELTLAVRASLLYPPTTYLSTDTSNCRCCRLPRPWYSITSR